MEKGDEIIFTNSETKEELSTSISFIHHYKDIQSMLETEGINNVLPGIETLEQAIKVYDAIEDYKERINKFGVYAYGIEVI